MNSFIEKIANGKVKVIGFILICVLFASFIAVIQPINAGPDEGMKMDICKYIADNGSLPHGGDPAIRDYTWGISYGFTPITPYIFSGLFIKITSIFIQDITAYYIAARLVSVICYGIFILFNIKIGRELFKNKFYKILFVCLTSLLPQMIYLGTYINNDCFAMMTISMIVYYCIMGVKHEWNYKTCIKLGLSIGLCAISYYNAYGYILMSAILFIASQLKNKITFKEILKKGLVVCSIIFIVAGWWFIRSAVIYNGDILGLKTTEEYSNKYAIDEFKSMNRTTPQRQGKSIIQMLIDDSWISITLHSFIGVFGGMMYGIKYYAAIIALLVIAIGYLAFVLYTAEARIVKKEKVDISTKMLHCFFTVNIIIPILLSIYYSYTNDFQPQGRYIMPILIPLMYFVVKGLGCIFEDGIKNAKIRKIAKVILVASLCIVLISSMRTLICAFI